MKIKELLKRLFKRTNGTTVPVKLEDIYPIPTREKFKDEKDKIKRIEQYKNEYLNLLKTKRTLVSKDLSSKDLENYKNIYLELFLNLLCETEEKVSFEKVNQQLIQEELDSFKTVYKKAYRLEWKDIDIPQKKWDKQEVKSKYLDIIIKAIKENIYLEEAKHLREETELRLIALSELLDSKILSKNKKNAIRNEFHNLYASFQIFVVQEEAMQKEKHTTSIELSTLDNHEFLSKDQEKQLINKKLEELKNFAKRVIPEQLERIEKRNLSSKLMIAKLESELEIYVYIHKKEVEHLKHVLLSFSFFQASNKEKYLEEILDLELHFKLFYQYGRNLIKKEDLERLYNLKFKILTIDILKEKSDYNDDTNILNNITNFELECYEKIILEKILSILNGQNSSIKTIAQKNHIKESEVIKKIVFFLKNGESNFSFKNILERKTLLSFLLAFDKVSGLEEFFSKIVGRKIDYVHRYFQPINFHENIFRWSIYLPLATIYEVAKCNISGKWDPVSYTLYEIYVLASSRFVKQQWLEGLVEISIPQNIEISDNLPTISSSFNNFIMPSTLKKIEGRILEGSINSIYLNDGLEILGEHALDIPTLKVVSFPASLKQIAKTSLPGKGIDIINIRDYEHSKLLNNENTLEDFISSCFVYGDSGGYSFPNLMIPIFKKLRLLDEDGNVALSLQKEDLIYSARPYLYSRQYEDEKVDKKDVRNSRIQEFIRDKIRERLEHNAIRKRKLD